MSEDRFVFIVEWFDSAAALVRNYNLTYFIKDKTIEMVINLLFSLISKIKEFFSKDANTLASNSKIYLLVPFSIYTQDSSKLSIMLINTLDRNSKQKEENLYF